MANMIKKAGANQIMMLDAHSPQLEGFFDHPVDCLKVIINTGGSCDFSVPPGSNPFFWGGGTFIQLGGLLEKGLGLGLTIYKN